MCMCVCLCVQEYAKARGKYIIDADILKRMQKHAVVMHPLPRVDEVGVSETRYSPTQPAVC